MALQDKLEGKDAQAQYHVRAADAQERGQKPVIAGQAVYDAANTDYKQPDGTYEG